MINLIGPRGQLTFGKIVPRWQSGDQSLGKIESCRAEDIRFNVTGNIFMLDQPFPLLKVVRRHGFTLIELLVVIAVIAVLVSVFIPVVPAMHRKADIVACTSNLRQAVVATNAAAADGSGRYPRMRGYDWEPYDSYTSPGVEGPYPNQPPWLADVLARYVGSSATNTVTKILRCPAALKNRAKTWLWDPNFSDYRYNVYYAQDKIPQYNSTEAVLFLDSTWPDWALGDLAHLGVVNVAYADGHVGTLTYAQYKELSPNTSDESLNDFFQLGWIKQ